MKKLYFLFALIVGMMTATALYAETVNGTCGETMTWTLDTQTGVLTISGSGEMTDFKSNNIPWYRYTSKMTSVTFSGNITSIGNRAFSGCSTLPSISLPSTIVRIGDGAFYGCSAMTTMQIPAAVTEIGMSAFAQMPSLTSFNVDASNEEFTVVDDVLLSKNKNTLVCYPAGNTRTSYVFPDEIKYIEFNAFSKATLLKELTCNSATPPSAGY